jgi:hypothetical protein
LLTTYRGEFLDHFVSDLVVLYQMTNPPSSARGADSVIVESKDSLESSIINRIRLTIDLQYDDWKQDRLGFESNH